ncbi:transglycosylase family protein [Streptomyces sp. Li-HN-5-11]|uniref:transglycosylase family protein n=1 Tax=Streptomyces sp. Li-HN-5-11 TaxID=3075432 RepID=UPI0028B08DF0|nr:transglycosylase family protein [Streptomyces sp. Li-HN-5-11]WNM35599.1 transglycosylase family protein [Streptomyces sp. Li-HN-5-11]
MLSGNGRHRRPRQAPALLVAAGVTGSAIALPLLGASGASAADGTTWDKVADCESGGSWSADTGNGYYGGLQLTQDDWEKYGGLAFASSPDQASRSQQIAVAEKILADRGPGVWPTCALLAGLTKDSGAAKVDTGVGGDSSSPSGSSGTSSSSGSSGSSLTNDLGLSDSSQGGSQDSSNSSGSSDSSAGHSQSSGSSASSGSSDASRANPSPSGSSTTKPDNSSKSDTPPGSGASGSSPSATPESGDPDNSGQTGGSSALVDTGALGGGRHRGDTATEGATEDRADSASGRHALRLDANVSGAAGGSYTVRSGDSLASIADSLALDGGWRALYAANHDAIGTDPNHIVAGQTLDVPAETAQK